MTKLKPIHPGEIILQEFLKLARAAAEAAALDAIPLLNPAVAAE